MNDVVVLTACNEHFIDAGRHTSSEQLRAIVVWPQPGERGDTVVR